jgi:CRP-like cAMP-binding protein
MEKITLFNSADADVVEARTVLFHEGDPGECMYAVVEGEVDLERNGTVLETVGPGGILGELALIDTAPRSATAITRTQARVATIDPKRFMFLVHEHPRFAIQVMRIMAERLRNANARAASD